jgi:excisionase family DNA binding protein
MENEGRGKVGLCSNLGHGMVKSRIRDACNERLLKMDEAASILGICRRALYRLIARGDLPAPVKVGRASRIPISDLVMYMDLLKQRRQGGDYDLQRI